MGSEPAGTERVDPGYPRPRLNARLQAWWLPVLVAAAGIATSVLLAQSLRGFERRHLAFIAETEAQQTAREFQKDTEARLEMFARIAQRYSANLRGQGPWHVELVGLEASLWADPSGRVTSVVPLEGHRELAGLDLSASDADAPALQRARATTRPAMGRPEPRPGRDSSLHLLVPISEGGQLQGFAVGVFSGHAFYEAALHSPLAAGWPVAVEEGSRLLYQSGSAPDGRWPGVAEAAVLGVPLRVSTSPSREVLARLNSPLPIVAFGAGSLISVLLAAAVGLAQSDRRRAHEAQTARAARSDADTRIKSILDAALDAVITMDADGIVASWNARAETMFGFPPAEAVGRRLSNLIVPPRYREAHAQGLARYRATGEGAVLGRRVELTALRRDGTELPVELTVTVVEEKGGPLFSAFVADITDRKRAQQRLLAHHVATRTLTESSTLADAAPRMLAAVGAALAWDVGALWTVDRESAAMRCGTVWQASAQSAPEFAAIVRTLALPKGVGLAGRVWLGGETAWIVDIAADTSLPKLAVAVREGLRTAAAFPIRFRGDVVAVAEFLSRERRDRDEEVVGIMADLGSQVEHFWQRRRAEKAMRAAQARLTHVLASSPAVLYALAVEGDTLVPTWVSDNLERLTGYTPREVDGAEWWKERLHPEDRDRVVGEQAALMSRGQIAREYRFRHKDGHYLWVRDERVLLRGPDGAPAEVIGSWSDVSALKQAELELEATAEEYRLLFDSNPHPMWVYDDQTRRFLAVNEAALRHYGYSREEFLAMSLVDIRPAEEVPALEEFVAARRRQGRVATFAPDRVWKHRKKDGSVIEVKVAGSAITFEGRPAWLALAQDVTEEKRLEAQLRQSQKMESVGRLAGGVAHDFNNLLGVITGYGELLQRDVGPGHPAFARVAEIRKAAERAAALTRQLLAFSRKQILEPKVLDLNTVVAETEKMLRRLIGEDIQLITVFTDTLGAVKADPGQIEQVIVNLAVNARDAMPGGGKLIIETANAELDEVYARKQPEAAVGPHVVLAVSDTGHGMDASTLSHIFEPFFTTKEPGKGTGLGLATVHGIVRQSGGHVNVYSEKGRGTTFKIYLPRFDHGRRAAAAPSTAASAPLGTETILLVEDEPSLRVLIGEILEAAGYTVLEGPTPEEALSVAGAFAGAIPLLLTDVILPRMSGRQVADALRASRPGTRVLFMSGYTDDAIGHHGILEADIHFLQKPFTTEALLHKVREVLDG